MCSSLPQTSPGRRRAPRLQKTWNPRFTECSPNNNTSDGTIVWTETLVLGLWLILAGSDIRRQRGLGSGKTVSLDKVTLRSKRLGLIDRPDRLSQQGLDLGGAEPAGRPPTGPRSRAACRGSLFWALSGSIFAN